jgi:hypothetical protein
MPSSVTAEEGSTSSIKKLVQLAKPEKKPLTIAIGLVSIGWKRQLDMM